MTEGWPEGVGRVARDTVDSTMAEARRQADVTPADTWFHALRQTAGTGRRGRAWADGGGNFAASLLMRRNEPPARLALRSFVAALALHDALVTVTGRVEPYALKWPNDVLMQGGKLAGILLETHGDALIVGIGVNLKTAPTVAALEPGAVAPRALVDLGVAVAPEEFLDALAPAFAIWDGRLRDFGFAPLREAWLARAAKLGETVTAKLPGEVIEGRFASLDDGGALVLETAKGRRAIAAGDVYFGGGQG